MKTSNKRSNRIRNDLLSDPKDSKLEFQGAMFDSTSYNIQIYSSIQGLKNTGVSFQHDINQGNNKVKLEIPKIQQADSAIDLDQESNEAYLDAKGV